MDLTKQREEGIGKRLDVSNGPPVHGYGDERHSFDISSYKIKMTLQLIKNQNIGVQAKFKFYFK